MISKASAEAMMRLYEGRQVAVYDGRTQSNCTEGYIVDIAFECMVICHHQDPEWFELAHSLIALNTIVEVQVFPKAE